MTAPLPQCLIFHVPHDSTDVPEEVRHQFALSESDLADELVKMTDHLTLDLFTSNVPESQIVRAPVSRLVVDVERFEDDELEPMSIRGMGAVYLKTSSGKALRHPISAEARRKLIDTWYRPHHLRLESMTQNLLDRFGQVLLIDAHSFPSTPLPYEDDQHSDRPDICIGTDEFHTPSALAAALVDSFQNDGFTVKLNSPFSGALVPIRYYREDIRVSAAMVEVKRDLYVDELSGQPSKSFAEMAERIQRCISTAVNAWAMKEPDT
jgi:N-formylglutamate amidohydrolase